MKGFKIISSLAFLMKHLTSFFLFFFARPEHVSRFSWTFGFWNHAYFFFFLTKVETFFSFLLIQIIIHLRNAKIELFYRIHILLIKIFKKTLYTNKPLFLLWPKTKLIPRIKIYEHERKKKPNTQFIVFFEAVFIMVLCRLDFSGSFFFSGSTVSIFDG